GEVGGSNGNQVYPSVAGPFSLRAQPEGFCGNPRGIRREVAVTCWVRFTLVAKSTDANRSRAIAIVDRGRCKPHVHHRVIRWPQERQSNRRAQDRRSLIHC